MPDQSGAHNTGPSSLLDDSGAMVVLGRHEHQEHDLLAAWTVNETGMVEAVAVTDVASHTTFHCHRTELGEMVFSKAVMPTYADD